jgi:hypothetical protein
LIAVTTIALLLSVSTLPGPRHSRPQAENQLTNLERQTGHYLDDLDVALMLLASAQTLYRRLEQQRARLLQILAKRIIVNADGEIIDHELHSPFTYLRTLVTNPQMSDPRGYGSTQVRLGAPGRIRTCGRRLRRPPL